MVFDCDGNYLGGLRWAPEMSERVLSIGISKGWAVDRQLKGDRWLTGVQSYLGTYSDVVVWPD